MRRTECQAGPAVCRIRYLLATLCLVISGSAGAAGGNIDAGTSAGQAPRILRYVSDLGAFDGRRCFGMVLEAHDGIPQAVCNLGRLDAALCDSVENRGSSPQQLQLAFAVADELAARGAAAVSADCRETLPQARLADVVLSPVAITLSQLDAEQRFIVGIGLNYREHREETGAEDNAGVAVDEVLVFPKFVAPTGAYAPVYTGVKVGSPAALPVRLLDYEVELGMLLLEDLDLNDPPGSYAEFIDAVAFFTANDVSDREPIILDSEFGYTRGKSHPTYLPTGPWMIHGRHLQPLAPGEGRERLELELLVREPDRGQLAVTGQQLQDSATDRMILGPWKIVQTLAARYRQGIRSCMRDAAGEARYIHTRDGVIPAGSLILTGTPGGTAIREPGALEKLELFLRGGLTLSGARQLLVRDSESLIPESHYLQPGDQVETAITLLGRQRWTVVADAARLRYGIDAPGDCRIDPGRE
ncbi:MAG: fumarylacetoacetate hydrolase family protein [Gammaproteobacteria bacterium]|jgi:2-keto-4-pentenoate hydratase/2-oxohepta-3-ene-1,7-dioic acid hydratase in catechol pathway